MNGLKRYFNRDAAQTARKASLAAAGLNIAEILILTPLIFLLALRPEALTPSAPTRIAGVLVCVLMLINNVLSIGNGRLWNRMLLQNDMLRDALAQVEALNTRLRTQRHDFLNHLQVVYSFLEMDENAQARRYIDALTGQMQVQSLSVRTALPAVNALLQIKLPQCERHGIDAVLRVTSDWRAIPIAEWELCRVLGNLVDNAMDALNTSDRPSKRLELELGFDGGFYTLCCRNNGPAIEPGNLGRIFNVGFSTKKEGRGLGLGIVKSIVEDAGGTVTLRSDDQWTAFFCRVPEKRG